MARQGKKKPNKSKPKPKSQVNSHTPKNIEMSIYDIATTGEGIGRYKKKNYRVPFTIPGERLTVQLAHPKEQRANGVALLAVSGDRVRARCAHFGMMGCANCQWQHMNYEAQLALKTDILISELERNGGFDSDEIGLEMTIPAPDLWHYRTQADFFPTPQGQLGFWSDDKRQAIPLAECHTVRADVWQLFEELNLDVPNLTNVRIQVGSNDTAMVIIRTKDETVPELESTLPISINFLLNDNVPVNLVGNTHIRQTLFAKSFRVTAGTQFRTNPPQIEKMIELVADYLNPQADDVILDLYGGVGVFSAFIAPLVSHVTYVESYPPAATDAEDNLAGSENIDIIEGAVEEVLPDLIEDEEIFFHAAILDPSRQGISPEALNSITALNIERLVYVSQDPASFAKDAKQLVKNHGYQLVRVQPIDFDPQTYRVQSIALFERKFEE